MSRSKKRQKKKQSQLVAVLIGIVVLMFAAVGTLGFFFLKKMKEANVPILPNTQEITDVGVRPGQNNGMPNNSDGDLTADKTHDVPVYLDNYLNGKGETILDQEEQPSAKEEKNIVDNLVDSLIEKTQKENESNKNKVVSNDEGYLEIHFIDVGQGDSALLKFVDTNPSNGDDSAAMLVDAGDKDKGATVRNYIQKQGVTELSYFVCTHPNADHIGGAASVVSNVPIESGIVWAPTFEKDTKVYENLMNEIFYKSYKYEEPKYGEEYELGLATFVFVAPTQTHEDVNSNSLVFKIWYGDDSFLFVGDCEEEEEEEIANGKYSSVIDCDVLKVGHHGSKTASSKKFLELVSPAYAVISCGESNKYAHPHAAALNNLRTNGAELFRTDVQGSIVATSFGNGITWNASPCNDWTAGE